MPAVVDSDMLSAQASPAVQARINQFLKVPAGFRQDSASINPQGFSVFDHEQMAAVIQMTQNLMQTANSNPQNPLEKVMDQAEALARTNDPEAVRQALMIFITHHPAATRANVRIASLAHRASAVATPVPSRPHFSLPSQFVPTSGATRLRPQGQQQQQQQQQQGVAGIQASVDRLNVQGPGQQQPVVVPRPQGQSPPSQSPPSQRPPAAQQGQAAPRPPAGQAQPISPPAQRPPQQQPQQQPVGQQGPAPEGSAAPGKTIAQAFIDARRDPEESLDFWREDANLNEHHEHWHIVYPSGGVPNPRDPTRLSLKDRQGELFVFMHQQMIARYNAERAGVGLPPVEPLSDLRSPIPQGDVPEDDLRINGRSFTPRPYNIALNDLGKKGQKGYIPLAQLEQWRDNLIKAIDRGTFSDGTPITADILGCTLESNMNGKDRDGLGNLHNMGHVFLAYIADPANYQSGSTIPGLMYETRTAVRDPVFWRWHTLIDRLFARWQDRQPPQTITDAPPVSFRKTITPQKHASPDIILAFSDVLKTAGVKVGDPAAVDAWAQQTFGGDKWGLDFSGKTQVTTDELQTAIRKRQMMWKEDSGKTEEVSYLYPRDFYYFFRIENKAATEQNVTLRVFLVQTSMSEDRRSYIEMDKFKATLPPQSKKIISRPCDLASVIRKPAQKREDELDDRTDRQLGGSGDAYCDCGWPYNLLVPRGTPQGTPFRLVVVATDWNKDQVPNREGCGSMSFCGAKEKYPDAREMGYPFNRRFPGKIAEAIAQNPAWASRDVNVRWVASVPDAF
ncbi:Phenoloxidase 2 [Borealophlyctis nickersoniae]|nr:Phenoloxidase 2 [Borealophlyctis nickersoniae]